MYNIVKINIKLEIAVHTLEAAVLSSPVTSVASCCAVYREHWSTDHSIQRNWTKCVENQITIYCSL